MANTLTNTASSTDANGAEWTNLSEQSEQSPSSAPAIHFPTRAPDVDLLGQMLGSGFADRMWLVQINARFVQLTELLYLVAEQCDGKQSYAEIAAVIAASSEWQMTADDVEYLVMQKLVPIGIVVSPTSGAEAPMASQSAQSLLRLGLRRRVISADVIEPIARRLQHLFHPALVIPLLLVGVLAHGWLYLDHGISGIVSSVLKTPGILIALFIMSIVPGFWHEFGHASALRYGGGRARSIGVGIYIMDPAFYTDVTDSYRLGRWARVRTGLGGVYFDMMLSTVFIIAYVLTGAEFLLLLVVLNNINTIYQFFPLIRLDGYWILADLSGVPDFYSMMGAYVRSIIPIPAWKGMKLPDLKPWVKVVFGLYTIIAFPGMLYFMYMLLRRVPGILSVTRDAFEVQVDGLSIAWQQSDWLMMFANISQLLLLVVAMIGLSYFLTSLLKMYFMLVWKLGRLLLSRVGLAFRASHA